MKTFFNFYIDFFTLGSGLLISIILGIKTWKESAGKTRLGLLPFLFLAPVLIITSMITHLFEVTYHAMNQDLQAIGPLIFSFIHFTCFHVY